MICSNSIKNIRGVLMLVNNGNYMLPLTSNISPKVDDSYITELIVNGDAVYFDLTNIKANDTQAVTHKDIITNEVRISTPSNIKFTARIGSADNIVISGLNLIGATKGWFVSDSGFYGKLDYKYGGTQLALRPTTISTAMNDPFPDTITASSGNLPSVQITFDMGTYDDIAAVSHIPSTDLSMDCLVSLEPVMPVIYQRDNNDILIIITDLNGVRVPVPWSTAPVFRLNNLLWEQGTALFHIQDSGKPMIGMEWTGSWSGLYCAKPLVYYL